MFKVGEHERGFDDVADLAWAGGDVNGLALSDRDVTRRAQCPDG
jgi:hypothetical protein